MPSRIQHIVSGALVAGALWVASGSAHAATYRWVGPDNGAWNNAANWFPRIVPGSNDNVVIDAKKIVSVPLDVTVANLSVGAGAEVKTLGKIKVTDVTNSLGLFTGAGTLDIPAGATALYDVSAANILATTLGTGPAVVFAPINNKGKIITKVAQGCRVDFAAIHNEGSTQVVSDGTVTFKDIENTSDLSISASGTLTLADIDNAAGASLSIAATTAPNLLAPVSGLLGNTLDSVGGLLGGSDSTDSVDPSVVHLDVLSNHAGGVVKLSGSKTGRYFNGQAITNAGDMQISGAQTLLEGSITNTSEGTLTLDSDASIFPADGKAPKLKNAGKIIKTAGSDAVLSVDWSNSGEVVIENGTLHVRVPLGKTCKQTDGVTTLEGGVLAIENALGLLEGGTFEIEGGALDGIGTIDGNVLNSGGSIRPGHSPGTIVINGNYTQTANGMLDMEVGGTDPGTSYDQILVNGTAYLDGTLNFVRWGGFVPKSGDVYTLFTYYSKAGNFAKFVDKAPVSGLAYSTTLTPTDYEVNCYSTAPTSSSTTTTSDAAPVVSISNPVDATGVRSIASATGQASDANGIKSVTCRLYRYANPVTGVAAGFWDGGSAWTSSATAANEEPVSGTTSWTFNFPTLVAGRYSLRATATDMTGSATSSNTIAFWVDPNAPTVLTIDTPANKASVSSLTQVSGTTSDASDGSGVTSVKCQLKRVADNLYWTGSTWVSTATSWTTTLSGTKWTRTTGFPSGTNLKAGTYNIIAVATDRAGNTKTVTNTFTVPTSTSSG